MNDLSGEMLGQYQLIEQIGKGGMATVYRAVQQSIGRTVAIKVIAPELAEEKEFLTRFIREARIIASLQHPHILEVHDFGRQGRLTYLVMRLMTGGSLKDELQARGMELNRVVQIVQQIGSALDYAHDRGIVHRDLKPSNVLLDEDRNVALTDFGIAKMVGGSTLAADLTLAGEVMGTPKYMAPEQWRAEPIDGRADVYALGILLYQMLTGQVPFSAQTPHSLMYQHLDREPPMPHDIRPELPPALGPVIRKALAKDREQRYQRAGILAADLQDAIQQPRLPSAAPAAPPMTWHTRPSRPVRPQVGEDSPSELVVRNDQPKRPRQDAFPDPLRARQPRERSPQPSKREPEPVVVAPALHPYEAIAAQDQLPLPVFEDAPLPPRRVRTRLPQTQEVGIARLFGTMMAIGVSLVVFLGVVFFIVMNVTGQVGEPTRAPDSPAGPTPVPADARAFVEITYPPDNTHVRLGDVVPIQFTVTHPTPITRVELRWYNQVIAAIPANNNTVFSGEFAYPVPTTGLHALEVVPFTGSIEGHPAVVHLIAE